MARNHHRFEHPASAQTLKEGLAEYWLAHSQLKRDEHLCTSEARQFFRSHDVVHVVYGCGTSMPDEAVVKLASLFGTTGGRQVLRGYTRTETLDIYRRLPLGSTLIALLAAPYLVVRTIWRCTRQRRRWPWVGYEGFMDTPLREIRDQFGIRVAHERRSETYPT